MRVKFLKNVRYALSPPSREQFDCVAGEERDGIPEVDAEIMKSAGIAEILGSNADVTAEDVDEDESGKSNQTPWS